MSPGDRGQSPPLGACLAGSGPEKGQGREGCYLPSRPCRSPGERDSSHRCHRIGAFILSDIVLNFHAQVPTLPALPAEYGQRFPVWSPDNTTPLPPITEILAAP
ncbi:hypothetical protein LIER_30319 [Lithospermum erythrorhizon]|uniref:Uncharacterized protein n=1 Tax=Lithospermum erythrorhizon TaxID=34254 RepID=A0AAV3RN94_LITER